jgi:hypothetical protein
LQIAVSRLDENRATVVHAGGIEAIIKAMAANEESERILEQVRY